MKKLLIVITLLFASSTSAQYPTTSFTAGGNITAASASCLATNCVPIKLPASATTLTVGVTGTFSATLAVEESQDGGRTWTSAGSNITGAGTTSFTITAFSDFRVRASAYVSGNAGVNILVSASTNSGGSGVSSLNSLSGAVTIAAGTNVTLTPSGNTITIASTGGGGGFTPSINGTPLSTAGLNLETSTANVTGLICAPTLVSTINVIPCEVSGTINAANVSTLNQNTTGTAANLSGTPALPNGTTATTQATGDNTTQLATDAFVLGNTTQTIASGTATLGASAISPNTCATTVTVTATGVATTDNILGDFNANPTGSLGYQPGAMLTIVKYPTSGNVNFTVCNNTPNSITPAAQTVNWRVVR